MPFSWPATRRLAAVQLSIVHLGLGAIIVFGGSQRFPAPTYSTLLGVTDGSAWPYGFCFLLVGCALAFPHPAVNRAGHVAAIVCLDIFAALFLVAVFQSPSAAATASWAYFSLGMIHGFVLAMSLVYKKEEPPASHGVEPGGDA